MKLLLDATRCQGYGLCQEHLADVIELDEWGYASVVGEVTDSHAALAAAEACPAQALRLVR